MRRVRQTSGTLAVQQAPVPEPGAGELLVRNEAIGVTLPVVRKLGRADGPEAIGGEIAGTVEAVGPGVTAYAAGDRVTGLCFGDAYAEFAVLGCAMASAVPEGASAADAVALVRGGLVALGALEAAGPRPGETALVTAAASGAGHLAVQLARAARGAKRVVAAVSDPEGKGDFLRALGADEVIGYGDEDWRGPYDYALDAVGGDVLTPAVSALADGGRLVAYSSGGGTLAAYDLLVGGKTVTGFQIARIAREQPGTYAAWRDELWRLHASGELRPAVSATFPLVGAAEAHALIERRANLGKVVLVP